MIFSFLSVVLLFALVVVLLLIKGELTNMALSLQDLRDAITAVGVAVDQDAAQDQLVIAAIEKLIKKIEENPNAQDFTTEVAALSAVINVLKNSNTGVQTELDKVDGSTPPAGAPVINPSLTADGQVGLPFSYAIQATLSPDSFASGALPAGLTLNASSGLITGIPTTVGATSVNISATNSTGTGNAVLVITIA